MPTWFLNRSFFESLVPRIMRCDDHGLSRMNEGNSAPTIQLLLKQKFTIPSLCKFPRIESKHRGAVSHMATVASVMTFPNGRLCSDSRKPPIKRNSSDFFFSEDLLDVLTNVVVTT